MWFAHEHSHHELCHRCIILIKSTLKAIGSSDHITEEERISKERIHPQFSYKRRFDNSYPLTPEEERNERILRERNISINQQNIQRERDTTIPNLQELEKILRKLINTPFNFSLKNFNEKEFASKIEQHIQQILSDRGNIPNKINALRQVGQEVLTLDKAIKSAVMKLR